MKMMGKKLAAFTLRTPEGLRAGTGNKPPMEGAFSRRCKVRDQNPEQNAAHIHSHSHAHTRAIDTSWTTDETDHPPIESQSVQMIIRAMSSLV